MSMSKKEKATAARKNAEAMKAKKKTARSTSSGAETTAPKGKAKGKSNVGQAKKK